MPLNRIGISAESVFAAATTQNQSIKGRQTVAEIVGIEPREQTGMRSTEYQAASGD